MHDNGAMCAHRVHINEKVLCTYLDCAMMQSQEQNTSGDTGAHLKGGTQMTRTSRVEELTNAMKSFGKDKYMKSELLPEMFALQQEIVELTFNGEHAATGDLKIWDVERHLEQLNQEYGNPADEELQRFKTGSKALCNLIKAEISGNRGEAKAFRVLQYIHSRYIVLKNIELADGDLRTELDAIVITPSAVTIVEVKNTSKNIFIDENGDYYRTGEFLKWDCNIAEKMAVKEELLRKVLTEAGFGDMQMRSVVVFTDNRIEVQNKYRLIRTCFVSQLAYIIEGFRGNRTLSEEEMETVESSIKAAECKEAYPFELDVAQYKLDFATLMAVLEEASTEANKADSEQEEAKTNSETVWMVFRRLLKNKTAGNAAAAAALTIISTAAFEVARKGGFLR